MQVIFMDGLDHAPDEIAAYRDHAMRTHPGACGQQKEEDGKVWIMTSADRQELEAYRALGTVEELRERVRVPFPTNDDYAPLPYSDPAMEAVEAYEDAWDYPAPEQQKRYSGLLEEE